MKDSLKSIAVLDDSDSMNKLIKIGLDQAGFIVLLFENGIEFLDYCSVEGNLIPDIVLIDINMPRMNGVSVLENALQIDSLSNTIFIAFTAYLSGYDEKWLGYLGFDDVLLKPVNFDTLIEKTEKWITNKHDTIAVRKPYKNLLAAIEELSSLRIRTTILEKDYIQKLLSPFVFTALESGNELKPCYKDIAIGFVDLRGFTRLMNQLEINQINKILNIFFDMCAETINEEKGFLDKFVGDEVIWFHQDSGIEENSNQCLKTALKIFKKLKAVNKEIRDKLHIKINLEIGIGVACGICAVGIFGSPKYRIQYSVIGPSVNLASRLCSMARSGEVLIGGELIEYCKYRSKKVGFQAIKGFDHDIEVKRLLIPKEL